MGTQKITIKGIHCDACVALIKMELEEHGLEMRMQSIQIQSGNLGEVVFADISRKELEKARQVIEAMDNYSVVTINL